MKKSVTVLGVHDGHDAGAALIRDGKVLLIHKKKGLGAFDAYRDKFYAGCEKNGVSTDLAKELWAHLMHFGCLSGRTRIVISEGGIS